MNTDFLVFIFGAVFTLIGYYLGKHMTETKLDNAWFDGYRAGELAGRDERF